MTGITRCPLGLMRIRVVRPTPLQKPVAEMASSGRSSTVSAGNTCGFEGQRYELHARGGSALVNLFRRSLSPDYVSVVNDRDFFSSVVSG